MVQLFSSEWVVPYKHGQHLACIIDIEKAAMSNYKLQDGNDFVCVLGGFKKKEKYLLLFTRDESKVRGGCLSVCLCEKR